MTISGKKDGSKEGSVTDDTVFQAGEVKKLAIRGVSSLYVRHAVVSSLSFVGLLVLARILTPEIFGIFAIAGFVTHSLEAISRLGLSSWLIRKKETVTDNELATAFTLQLGMTFVLLAILYISAPLLTEHYGMDDSMVWLFRVLGLSFLLSAFSSIPSVILQRKLRHDLIAVSAVGEFIIYQVVAIGLALAGFEIWALVVATLLRGISGVVIINYLAWWKPLISVDLRAARQILAFGIPILITRFGSLANVAVVTVLIASSLGASAVGYVNFARTSMNAAAQEPLTLLANVQVRVFSTMQDDIGKLKRVLEMNLFAGSSISFLLGSTLVALAAPLVTIIVGEKWLPSLPLIYITTPAYIMLAIVMPYSQTLKALGDANTPMLFTFLLVSLQVLFVVMLIGDFQLISYAIAYSAAYLLATPYIMWKLHKIVAPRTLRNVLPPLISAISSGSITYFVSTAIGGLAGIFSGLLINIAVFALLLTLFRGDELSRMLKDVAVSIRPSAMESNNQTIPRTCRLLNRLHYKNFVPDA